MPYMIWSFDGSPAATRSSQRRNATASSGYPQSISASSVSAESRSRQYRNPSCARPPAPPAATTSAGDDASGGGVRERLEGEQRANDRLAVRPAVAAAARPFGPESLGGRRVRRPRRAAAGEGDGRMPRQLERDALSRHHLEPARHARLADVDLRGSQPERSGLAVSRTPPPSADPRRGRAYPKRPTRITSTGTTPSTPSTMRTTSWRPPGTTGMKSMRRTTPPSHPELRLEIIVSPR